MQRKDMETAGRHLSELTSEEYKGGDERPSVEPARAPQNNGKPRLHSREEEDGRTVVHVSSQCDGAARKSQSRPHSLRKHSNRLRSDGDAKTDCEAFGVHRRRS